MLAALRATGWHTFALTNNTGTVFSIDRIEPNIDVSQIAVADQFVTVFWRRDDGTLVRIVPPLETPATPISVADGETVEFIAFYDPAIRNGNERTVEEQYPDWYDDPDTTVNEQEIRPAHTFASGDYLSVITDSGLSYRVDLVGGSTYDSDITYDGAVSFQDLFRLNDLLDMGWPVVDTSIQEVSITGVDLEGTFTLSFDGQTTEPIPWNASNGEVEAALEHLTNVVDVRVINPLIGNSDSDWQIIFMNPGGDDVRPLALNLSDVTGTSVSGNVIPVDSRFDLTSDINARHPDGAQQMTGMAYWPVDGQPRREIGLGEFGPLNVESLRVRSPLLDLDTDNSSGALGVGYLAEYTGSPVRVASDSAKFANGLLRQLSGLSVVVTDDTIGSQLDFEGALPDDVSVTGEETSNLQFVGQASIEAYANLLRTITFSTTATSATSVTIEVQAFGDAESFTRLSDDRELSGNIAVATILIRPSNGTVDGESAAPLLATDDATPLVASAVSSAAFSEYETGNAETTDSPLQPAGDIAAFDMAEPVKTSQEPFTLQLASSSRQAEESPIAEVSESAMSDSATLLGAAVDEALVDYSSQDGTCTEYPLDLLATLPPHRSGYEPRRRSSRL